MPNYNNKKKSFAVTVDTFVPGERKLVLKRLKPPPPHVRVWVADFQCDWSDRNKKSPAFYGRAFQKTRTRQARGAWKAARA
jgi:hypothetical protein